VYPIYSGSRNRRARPAPLRAPANWPLRRPAGQGRRIDEARLATAAFTPGLSLASPKWS